ncbi:unnamed protein product [Parajaminaea phylloscopi]
MSQVRNIKVDKWPGCSGDMNIEDFVRVAILGNCPSFLVCHQKWAALGCPDLDTSHWPRFGSEYLPSSYHDLLPTFLAASDYFVARVAAQWYGESWPEMSLADMAPFIVLELIATADLEAASAAREAQMLGHELSEQERLFIWHNSVSSRMYVHTQHMQYRAAMCTHSEQQDCLLRVCFGQCFDLERHRTREIHSFLRNLQPRFPTFGVHAMQAAYTEGPTHWVQPEALDLLASQARLQQELGQSFTKRASKRKRSGSLGFSDDVALQHKRPATTSLLISILHNPSRVDILGMLCSTSSGQPAAGTDGDLSSNSGRFEVVSDGLDDVAVDSTSHPAYESRLSAPLAAASASPKTYVEVSPLDTAASAGSLTQGSQPSGTSCGRAPLREDVTAAHAVNSRPETCRSSSVIPSGVVDADSAPWGSHSHHPPRPRGRLSVVSLTSSSSESGSPRVIPRRVSPPRVDDDAAVQDDHASSPGGAPSPSSVPSPSAKKERTQQSRDKMRRYAARVKRQRQALNIVCDEIDRTVNSIGSVATAYLRNGRQRWRNDKAALDGLAASDRAMPVFASPAEKLNFQKRASKARKRASEAGHLETLAATATLILETMRAQRLEVVEVQVIDAVADVLKQHVAFWEDLIEAEKRWLSSSTSTWVGGQAATGSSSQRGSGRRSIQELLHHIGMQDSDRSSRSMTIEVSPRPRSPLRLPASPVLQVPQRVTSPPPHLPPQYGLVTAGYHHMPRSYMPPRMAPQSHPSTAPGHSQQRPSPRQAQHPLLPSSSSLQHLPPISALFAPAPAVGYATSR